MTDKKIILFIHISKTAGTTFKSILSNSLGLSFVNSMAAKPYVITPELTKIIKFFFPKVKAIGGHNISLEGEFLSDKYFRITFIRNPIRRTISHFQHHCRGRGIDDINLAMSQFEDFIKNPINQNHQIKKIGLTDDFDKAIDFIDRAFDFIGLTEEFDISMQVLQQKCPVRIDPQYTPVQTSKNSEIASRLKNSPEHMDLIEQYNEVDIKLYNYVRTNYFDNGYYKNYSFDKELKMNTRKSKRTFNYLKSIYYHRFVFRPYFKFFYSSGVAKDGK